MPTPATGATGHDRDELPQSVEFSLPGRTTCLSPEALDCGTPLVCDGEWPVDRLRAGIPIICPL